MRRGGQPQQTTPLKILGDDRGRITRLEFRGPGIRFNRDNQGGYLDVTVNAVDGDGNGLLLANESGGDTLIENHGGGDILVDSFDAFDVAASNDLRLRSGGGGSFTVQQALFLISALTGTSATVNVSVQDGCYFLVRNVSPGTVEYMRVGTAGTIVKLLSGGKLQVLDSSSAPIFEVRENGSVHIKTGTTIVADL